MATDISSALNSMAAMATSCGQLSTDWPGSATSVIAWITASSSPTTTCAPPHSMCRYRTAGGRLVAGDKLKHQSRSSQVMVQGSRWRHRTLR